MKTKAWQKGLSILLGTLLALAVLERVLRIGAVANVRVAIRSDA